MRPYTEFGLKASTIMNQKRITMVAIAKHLGISPQYVSGLLAGVNDGKKAQERKKQIAEFIGMKEGTVI